MSQTLFLSTVTREFGELRRRLAAFLQRTKKVHVRHQDDFAHRGVPTLHVLEEEVAISDIVVHVIGEHPGWAPPSPQVEDFLQRHPDFATQFGDVVAAARNDTYVIDGPKGKTQMTGIPATQWEAWLALYFGRRLCSFELPERLIRNITQQRHSQRLHDSHNHPKVVPDEERVFDEILASLIELGMLTADDIRRPINLPYQPLGELFLGRAPFLEKLHHSLQQSNKAATAVTQQAVYGLGGVGKTRLVVEYAWQHADEFTAVLFVTADTLESLNGQLAELTGPLVLNLPEQTLADQNAKVAAAIRWLQDHPGWCLIIDNVDRPDVAEHVEQLVAGLHKGHVLITSRLTNWAGDVESLALDVLETTHAAAFLLARTDPAKYSRSRKATADDQALAGSIAEDLDGLALALEQAGAYICQTRCTLAQYQTKWKSHDATVLQHHDKNMKYIGPLDPTSPGNDKVKRSLDTTWLTTLEELSSEEVALLNVLAWFAPDPIPRWILDEYKPLSSVLSVSSVVQDETSPTTEDTALISARDLLPNLADFSMIRWDHQQDEVGVHRVVQEILRNHQPDPVPQLTTALSMLFAAMPEGRSDDVRTWPKWNPLQPHVTFATDQAHPRQIDEPTDVLMSYLGTLLRAKALYNAAEVLERKTLAIAEQLHDRESPIVAVRLNNLAETLRVTNQLSEAEPLYRRALEIDEKAYGPDHPAVAIRLNNLALLLKTTNRLSEAEPLYRRALKIGEKTYGPDHPKVALRLNNLAGLLRATDRLSEAERSYRRALEIDEKSCGPDHPEVAIDLNNLGLLLQDTGRVQEGIPLCERAWRIFQTSYGDDHPLTRRCKQNLDNMRTE